MNKVESVNKMPELSEKVCTMGLFAVESCTLLRHPDGITPCGLLGRGERVSVLPSEQDAVLAQDDIRRWSLVRSVRGEEGYVLSNMLTDNGGNTSIRDWTDNYLRLHKDANNHFTGGSPFECDFSVNDKPMFEKEIPKQCYGLYLNGTSEVLENIDNFIGLAGRTKINCFVIDVKKNGLPGYKADTMRLFSPSAYECAPDNEELYRNAVQKLHRNGIWAVARIVTFKDCHFAADHPEHTLWDNKTDQPFLVEKSYWSSAFSRLAWEYNVSLACEVVDRFGFDEINFDYVRFPVMNPKERDIDLRNVYGESRVQTIQRFVKYASECIHRHKAYVSIDVFGETANAGNSTAYGQFWPAISNYCDIICGMPYPDHFSNGYYGIIRPWNHPYVIMNAWGRRVLERQDETPSPARVRTWIKTSRVKSFVDPDGIDYDAGNIEREIRGLYAAGLTDGYTAWLSTTDYDRYNSQAPAFSVDYLT